MFSIYCNQYCVIKGAMYNYRKLVCGRYSRHNTCNVTLILYAYIYALTLYSCSAYIVFWYNIYFTDVSIPCTVWNQCTAILKTYTALLRWVCKTKSRSKSLTSTTERDELSMTIYYSTIWEVVSGRCYLCAVALGRCDLRVTGHWTEKAVPGTDLAAGPALLIDPHGYLLHMIK